MVRKGSPVRVRQRAWDEPAGDGGFSLPGGGAENLAFAERFTDEYRQTFERLAK
jgi:hypothetical protein